MNYLNAHERVGIRVMYWGQFPPDELLEFELVDYFSSPVVREGNGMYHIYYAIARANNEKLGLIEGDEVELHISYKTYCNAISSLPTQIKTPCLRKFAEGKNLFIRIVKLNARTIKIFHQEPREPTEEQLKEAKKQYSQIRQEHRIR